MDSSLNKTESIIETYTYVNSNENVFSNILNSLESVSNEGKEFLKVKVSVDGKFNNQLLEEYQHEGHGYAWFETYRIALRETFNWYKNLKKLNKATKLKPEYYCFHLLSTYFK